MVILKQSNFPRRPPTHIEGWLHTEGVEAEREVEEEEEDAIAAAAGRLRFFVEEGQMIPKLSMSTGF